MYAGIYTAFCLVMKMFMVAVPQRSAETHSRLVTQSYKDTGLEAVLSKV